MNVAMLINPNAGLLKGCSTPSEIKEKLAGLKYDPDISIAKSTRGINLFIEKVKKEKPNIVLIAGGDGTIAAIIKELREENVIFGLIPTGSMNNIGQSIGLGDELQQAVEVINQGHTETMDFGTVDGEVFIESVGVGLLAEIMNRIGEQDSKKQVLKVASHTISEVVGAETLKLKLIADDRDVDIETVWLTVTNTGRAAAALVDPGSNVHDHMLEIVYCEPIEKSEITHYTMAFMRNSHIREEKFHRIRARNIEIVLEKTANVHVDGEVIKRKELKIAVMPSAIKVFTP